MIFLLNFFDRLAVLYAQLRPVTLPVKGLTAAAGTPLATSYPSPIII